MTAADLAADTRVTPDAAIPGRYHLNLANHWDYLLPSGGAVMTCALRAAETHLADPELRLASATTIVSATRLYLIDTGVGAASGVPSDTAAARAAASFALSEALVS